jgi:hypothetical protein
MWVTCGTERERAQTEFYITGCGRVAHTPWERAPPASAAC